MSSADVVRRRGWATRWRRVVSRSRHGVRRHRTPGRRSLSDVSAEWQGPRSTSKVYKVSIRFNFLSTTVCGTYLLTTTERHMKDTRLHFEHRRQRWAALKTWTTWQGSVPSTVPTTHITLSDLQQRYVETSPLSVLPLESAPWTAHKTSSRYTQHLWLTRHIRHIPALFSHFPLSKRPFENSFIMRADSLTSVIHHHHHHQFNTHECSMNSKIHHMAQLVATLVRSTKLLYAGPG